MPDPLTPSINADVRAKSHVWLLWGIIALAAALRVYGALVHPVDQDELYTVMESQDLYRTALLPGIQSRPLYYIVQHLLFFVMPAHEPWTRLMPLVFGVVTVWLVSRVASRIADERAGLVAALIAACSPWHIYASEMARYYSLVGMLVTVTTLLLLDARERDTVAAWRRVAIPVAIGILVHPTFVVGVAVMLSFSFLRGRLSSPRWQAPSRNGLIGFTPLVGASIVLLFSSIFWLGPRRGVANGAARLDAANDRLLPAIVEWASPVLILSGLLGLGSMILAGRDRRSREAALTIAWGALSTALIVVLASRFTATYADYAIGMLPGAFVGVGLLTSWIVGESSKRALGVAAVVVSAIAPSTVSHVSDGTRFDYRPAFAAIRKLSPHRLTLVWPVAIADHYASDLRRDRLDRSAAALDGILSREGVVWAVVSEKRYGVSGSSSGDLGDWIIRRCRQTARYERPRFDYRQYRVTLFECKFGEDK